ncbi:MAG: TetR/AcrR family transcriptional regulator [Bacteriovorax sp.]|nr:TetR/AcrR family transcriptional regulator [Rhizobacter sp.]
MARGRAPGYDTQREQILARAAELFAQQGYTATSMNQVAQACGVSKPSLYHYVRDKYQLLVEIAEGHVTLLRRLATEAAEPLSLQSLPSAVPADPQARLRQLIDSFLGAYADSRAAHRVLTEDVKFLEPADRDRVLGVQREVVDAFAEAIAVARPELRGTELQKPLTMLLFGMMNWMFTWLQPGGRLTHAAMAPVVADLFLGGLEAVRKVGPVPLRPAVKVSARLPTKRRD